jgi:hypothetical protein
LIYGTEGIGKSTFAANAPRPIFISTEDGLGEIDCHKFPLARSYSEVIGALTVLQKEDHDYETVCLDSLDWLEKLIWDQVCREAKVSSIEKADGGYAKGYIHALTYWREIVDLLNGLRNQKNLAIILIAHSKIEKFEDPEAAPYDRYSPRLNKHAAALVCEWVDAVLFATRKIRTQKEDTGFGRTRTTAHALGGEGGERVLRCIGGPTCLAKNRYGFPEEIALSWSSLVLGLSHSQGVSANG